MHHGHLAFHSHFITKALGIFPYILEVSQEALLIYLPILEDSFFEDSLSNSIYWRKRKYIVYHTNTAFQPKDISFLKHSAVKDKSISCAFLLLI